MITSRGYSKDPGLMPEGIAITFGQDMMSEQGGIKNFLTVFQETMANYEEGGYWMHKCSNLPKIEVDHIYIIVCNRLYGKVYCGGYRYYNPYAGISDEMDEDLSNKGTFALTASGKRVRVDYNHIILAGPFERAPEKRILKGFQGFRYTTTLF